ncbi:MAG TPA: ABC transporter ATP-binding protein [Thermoanaerobaculia bacterium]|nr:ABC transporter ATP-binding protein [Thermoanaerobaculia bacterium]
MAEEASEHRDEESLGKAFEPRLFRRLLTLARPYRRYVAGSVAVLLLESTVQLSGPLLTAAAVDLLFTREKTEAPAAVRGLAAFFGLFGIDLAGPHGIEWIAGLSVAAALLGFGLTFVMVTWTSRMGQGVMYDLRKAIFGHLQRADIAFFDRTPVGRLMTRLTTDVDALNELFTSGFVALLGDVVVLAGIVALLFTMNAPLAAITFAILLPMLWVTNWFRKGARDTYRDVRVKIARVNAFLQEHLSGIGVVQLFRREAVARRDFSVVNDAHRAANIDSIFYYAVFYPALDFLSAVGMAAIIWYGGFQVVKGSMTIGAVVAFLQYSKRFYRPLMDLSEKYNILQAAMASSERIFQLLDKAPAVTAPSEPAPVKDPLRGEVVFEDVRFSYKPDEEILKGVSFHVPPGQTVALVGATGAGKSTILNLLLRFYDVTSGRVLVDGTDVRRFDPHRFREHVGIVQQDTFLFTGTIAENVSFFDPKVPRAAVEAACREVGLGRLLQRLPEGLDTRLSERGGGLSVGEKQLVSFARALVRDPRLLILDEATSSVDPETEAAIERAVARLLAGRTSIVVAHRLSTVVRAENILVFSHGEVRESGTHEALLSKGGLYARLYALQLKDREAAA